RRSDGHGVMAPRVTAADGADLLLAWYGDDVTGSTDALEALGAAGVPTVLFLAPPSREQLDADFPACRAVGVAGIARSLPTRGLRDEIEPILRALVELRPAAVHYKVCSTFDSSPDVGSIGAAIDLGWPILRPDWVPILVAAPALGRYTVFATHFATYRGEVYRLDRHPVMSRHPITPMTEPDLRRHLGAQTDRPIGLVDIRALEAGLDAAGAALDGELAAGRRVVVCDGIDDPTVAVAARLAWHRRPPDRPAFVVGSSGVETGLVDVWRTEELLGRGTTEPAGGRLGPPSGPVVVASGSASPWTAIQIGRAFDAGWADVPLDTERLVSDPKAAVDAAAATAERAVRDGSNVVVHAALGPDDARLVATRAIALGAGLDDRTLATRLGHALGATLTAVVASTGIRRAALAGGDASGWAARALRVEALEYVASLDPGVPLCRATRVAGSPDLELVLKGGQLGSEDVFVRLAA
ncbi:MAG TPA: four-carbon acid sugar kinase family protein, partial [Candidatus Limnocylindrales bacterium]|nr:four-carbon acid sugar kinase family protein [Candidatus Limnocylindrales bacterium]